jgi:predicted PurR-regulated permease PerM
VQSIPSHTIRQVLLMGLIFALFAVIFWNLSFFIPALLGAYTLYVLMRKPLEWLIDRRKWPKKIAAATLLLSSFP